MSTLDGRETAPAAMRPDSFVDPATGEVLEFDRAVTTGLSVGVPGTPAIWAEALRRWGKLDLADALAPAVELARRGFVVDEEFRGQTALNEERFRAFPDTAALFLPGGALPEVGSRSTNSDWPIPTPSSAAAGWSGSTTVSWAPRSWQRRRRPSIRAPG